MTAARRIGEACERLATEAELRRHVALQMLARPSAGSLRWARREIRIARACERKASALEDRWLARVVEKFDARPSPEPQPREECDQLFDGRACGLSASWWGRVSGTVTFRCAMHRDRFTPHRYPETAPGETP